MLKSIFSSAVVAFLLLFTITVNAQTKTINLEQTTGEFTIKSLTLSAGDYIFEVSNNGVDHELGFVLVPKGKSAPEDHIKAAYVKAPVKTGTASLTSIVTLEAGEYEYFCPLNPTAKYPLTVE